MLGTAQELARLHGALPVALGRHVVEIVRPGFGSRRLEVDVTEAGTARVELRLEPER
jgi:hypothetical protein